MSSDSAIQRKMSGRCVIIGDIHGCLDEFQELVRQTHPQPDDQIICLGDFMDKGPDPVGCVRFARENGLLSVLGNHEEKHLKWRRNETRAKQDPSYENKMRPLSEKQQAQNAALSDDDITWLQGLPLYLEPVPGTIVVHGGLFPGLSLEAQPKDKIIRARYVNAEGRHMPSDFDSPDPVPPGGIHWAEVWDGPYNVVYGHEAHSLTTVREDVRDQGVVCYGVDTGCVHGGRLTAMVIDDGEVSYVQVKAKRVYKEPPWAIPS